MKRLSIQSGTGGALRTLCAVTVAVAVAAGGAVAAFASSGARAAGASSTIRVALVEAATANLPFQVAAQDGLFKKEGLNVSLSTPSIPFSELPAALGKQFDIVIGSQPDLIRAHTSGIDVVALSGLQKDNPKDPG